MKPTIQIRKAGLADLDAITAIYNDAIANTTATFDTEPKTAAEQLKWFQEHGERYPILVAALDGTVVGWAGALPADRPAWAGPLVGFEILLRAEAAPPPAIRTPPREPAVDRDVALVLPEGTAAARVEEALRSAAGPLLERLWVFDEYRGAPLGTGRRSVAWRLVFRAPGRTLREAEVDAAFERAVTEVERRCGVRRREA